MARVDGTYRNSVAIVTGGGSGIGKALSEALAASGARVIVADLNGSAAEEVTQAINATGGRAQAETVDVRDAGAVQRLVDDTARDFGGVDYMFNNAGIAIVGEEREVSLEDWRRVLDVNLYGVIHGVRAVYPLMMRQGRGHIVNTASIAGLIPSPLEISYAASKYAVVGLSKSLRIEAAAFGVRVSVVCPGFIDTPIIHNSEIKPGLERSKILAMIPKPMAPERCARAILRGVARNRAVIVVTGHGKLLYWLERACPSLVGWGSLKILEKVRATRALS
jgi:NAD(P)-dependent dehydrogenase (short-subunit alcohol dehydrogenase family)